MKYDSNDYNDCNDYRMIDGCFLGKVKIIESL